MACISGYTNDVYYSYFDCCGNLQTGIGPLYQSVCVDQALSGSSVGVFLNPLSACTQNCNTGPLSYSFVTSGNCGTVSAGTITINVYGGSPPYTIDNIAPGSLSAQTSTSQFSFTGLTGGTYVFRINDSLGLQNNELYLNVAISECYSATITDVTGTTCNLNNGGFIVSASSLSSPYKLVVNKNGNFQTLLETPTLPFTITGLDDGIYDVLIYDYGFTTARTENVIVSGSTGIDYGFWVVNAANCVTIGGKAAVTGTTGTGPFTYQWSNGQTSQMVTGLTQGVYSVLVTDYYGCTLEKQVTIGQALPLGVGLITSVNPSCTGNDGSLTYTLTGGTAPFYYSATTGGVGYTLSDTFTLNNLASGSYSINVRDANFCEINLSGFLISQNGFYNVSNTVTNSVCNQNSGIISTTLNGTYGNYTYALTGLTTNEVRSTTSANQTNIFDNLPNDTYVLFISGQNTNCVYSENITVASQDKFSVNVSVTGATCGSPTGVVIINVGTGYTNWQTGNGLLDYTLSNGQQVYDINTSAFTYNNLPYGQYTVNVTDESNCTVSKSFTVSQGGGLNSVVLSTDCQNGINGSASVSIFEGEPPFTYNWSNNIPLGESGSTVNYLSGGSYTVQVIDNSGCTNYHNFTIDCTSTLVTGSTTYNLCGSNFTTTTGTKRGISEMLSEGYLDLTTGYTNCILNTVNLNCNITLNGSAFTQSFILTDDATWRNTIETILSGIPEVGSYNVNLINNTLIIKSNCVNGGIDPIGNGNFILELEIDYDISCEGILPTPTPTATPTPTPTATPTPTPTATPTPTPTATPTPTPTPTATPTPTPTNVNYRWYNNGNFSYYSSDPSVCTDTGCSFYVYTSTPTVTVGTILYMDSTLTTPVVGINVGVPNGGFGRCYLSNDCPIVGTRQVAQVNSVGQVINIYTC